MIFFLHISFVIGIGTGLLQFVQSAAAISSECPMRSVPLVRAEMQAAGELSLLFYYVSWSSDARQARLVYDGVAHYYKDYASFGAVDCWHMQCNCSRTHRQLPGMAINGGYPDKWPTLMVSYGRQLKLQYLGAWHFADLTRFMNHLIQPIDRIHSTTELGSLWKISDAVVLALLDSADSLAYKRFLATALHWLEFDPERNVRFAVTFGASAKEMLKVEHLPLPQLVFIDNRHALHSYNESQDSPWQPMEILQWLRPKLNPLLAVGYGTPVKIAQKARHMPVLALGIRMQSGMPGLGLKDETHRKENLDCEQYRLPEDSETDKWPHEEAAASVSTQHCYPAIQLNAATLANYYSINGYLNYLWSQYSHESHLKMESKQLLALHTRNRCLAHTHAEQGTPGLRIGIAKLVTKYGQLMWQHSEDQASLNRSLAVVLFDGSKYRGFLQQLGIDTQQQRQPSAKRAASAVQVFIVDASAEALHIMPHHQPFSYLALMDFIKQFYARQLPRIQRNSLVISQEASYIHTYNRQLLLQALQRANATNIVFMHRPDCALSTVLSQGLMQVAAMLHSPELNFIRLDAKANDLPWELSMPVSPALLVFPQYRPEESVLFPLDVRPDTANIMSFILAQLEPEQQLRLVLASCRRRLRHAHSCLDFAKNLVLQHVSQYLRYWEVFVKERDIILSHLKQFNDMHRVIERSIKL